ncbi:hypothetical protein HNY73_006767 [Argiope bruennichi]|uniref:Uncharacterized protein n=1 Tax=Argiope bruennichi TaxID=94029 RepID=A0A8T0FCW7_ARGBR|nr:hypothetical protein HNY73_006767 [Argiope bruennichi]
MIIIPYEFSREADVPPKWKVANWVMECLAHLHIEKSYLSYYNSATFKEGRDISGIASSDDFTDWPEKYERGTWLQQGIIDIIMHNKVKDFITR